MDLRIFRPNDGLLIRRISVIGILLFTAFGCVRWHAWMNDATRWFWPFSRTSLPRVAGIPLTWGIVGAIGLMVLGLVLGYLVCFANPKASTFLIETENELRKVTWPAYKPWFSSDTEVWGSTYVVFVVLVVMVFFLMGIDSVFHVLRQVIFVGK